MKAGGLTWSTRFSNFHVSTTKLGTARAAKHDHLRGLGADELIDYTVEEFSALRGILVDVVDVGVDRTELTARAAELDVPFVEFFLEPTRAVLFAFAEIVDTHGVRPTIAEIFPLAEVAKVDAPTRAELTGPSTRFSLDGQCGTHL